VYASEVAPDAPASGPCVAVEDERGRLVGSGLFSAPSQIRVRLYARGEVAWDEALIRQRVRRAAERRAGRDVARVVWSEADGLPGLVVDRYDGIVVFQVLHAAVEAWRATVVSVLRDELQPGVLIERSDAPVRRHEGLESRVEVVAGSYDAPSWHRVGDVRFEVDLLRGHKTGAYLDQADNYRVVAAHARGRRVLDVFSNAGGFALHAGRAGAASVEAVESSAEAVALGRRNAAAAGVSVQWHEANAFDWLRARAHGSERYGMVILDPPSFAKTREQLAEARRGYHELHVRALRLLEPGGVLATFACSHHVGWDELGDLVRRAAGDARRSGRLLARAGQALDHPILVAMPESEYLRGLILEVE
jgi:23S rRNA (cytosine1962-C5)-methyltransferase